MKNIFPKRVSSIILAMILCFTTVFTGMGITVNAASTSWNFKNSSFKSLGTISSTKTVENLTLIATSSKTMEVKTNSQTVSGTSYTHCLALGGTGSTSYRSVKVPVNGESNIKVVLKSSGSSSRSLVIANSSGSKLTTLTAGSTASLATYKYTGSAGYIYLYSAGSGINIYKIQVDTASSSSNSSSGSTSSGSSTSGSSGKGITMSGSGSTIENVVIKNAADNGIYVSGSNNTFKNVETCYNEDTGIQVSEGGSYNKFYDCYSHHNCDSGAENADGYAVKLHSGEGNYFENCTASYNVDDGWDLYAAHGAVEFVNCTANYNGYCNGLYGDGKLALF